jgi:hypothetical protein
MQVGRRTFGLLRGARLRNTWVICLFVGDNPEKSGLSPHTFRKEESRKARREEPAAHQVVGRVTAYQANDGYLV